MLQLFYMHWNIQDYNFAFGSVWVWNLSPTLSEEQTEGVWEQGAEEDIWTRDRWDVRRVEKTT
jgi:hypothetical protein